MAPLPGRVAIAYLSHSTGAALLRARGQKKPGWKTQVAWRNWWNKAI